MGKKKQNNVSFPFKDDLYNEYLLSDITGYGLM